MPYEMPTGIIRNLNPLTKPVVILHGIMGSCCSYFNEAAFLSEVAWDVSEYLPPYVGIGAARNASIHKFQVQQLAENNGMEFYFDPPWLGKMNGVVGDLKLRGHRVCSMRYDPVVGWYSPVALPEDPIVNTDILYQQLHPDWDGCPLSEPSAIEEWGRLYVDEKARIARTDTFAKNDKSWSCFVLPYDWRQDNFDTATALRAGLKKIRENFLPQLSKNLPFTIIAHSMGGIVARMLLESSDLAVAKSEVDQLIAVGTPHLGCLDLPGCALEIVDKDIVAEETSMFKKPFKASAARYLTLQDQSFLVTSSAACMGLCTDINFFQTDLRDSPAGRDKSKDETMESIDVKTSSWESTLDYEQHAVFGDAFADELDKDGHVVRNTSQSYDMHPEKRWFEIWNRFTSAWRKKAQRKRSTIHDLNPKVRTAPTGVSYTFIAQKGVRTLVGLELTRSFGIHLVKKFGNGDGTVPLQSALALSRNHQMGSDVDQPVVSTSTEHANLLNDKMVVKEVRKALDKHIKKFKGVVV